MRQEENSGFLCDYYLAPVEAPQREGQAPYVAECEDVIQSLGLTFDEACEFKSIWRRGRARQGFRKAESSALRDASKGLHYARRVYALELRKANKETSEGFDEARADIIGQNGNDGEHYALYPWREAPTWAKWAAMDYNGSCYWYDLEPEIECDGAYWKSTPTCSGFNSEPSRQVGWTDSLEARPNANV